VWTQKEAGVGTSIDSYYEYMLKSHVLFGDIEYLQMFQQAYTAVKSHIFRHPWYIEVKP